MIAGKEEALKKFYTKRAVAYNKVFDPKSPFTHDVLVDLAKFCKAMESTYHVDSHASAMLEGRRQVWLRIMEHLQLSHEEIYRLHIVKEIK